MESRIFRNQAVLRIDRGEEVMECLKTFASENGVRLASVVGIGASDNIEAGLFNTKTKIYESKVFSGEDFEVTSFTGNITVKDNEPYLHIHINFADKDFNAYGGHMSKCVISGACELFITVIDGEVGRISSEIGLNILDFK